MEFKEVIGRRRSIRYFAPYRPVEREKIQTILEAARLASCAVNATFLRAIVAQRDDLSHNRQHYSAQIDAFQRQVAGGLRQQVQYGRIVRSFLIHNGVMLQAGWQYCTQVEQE
jgi:nitroreductase